MFFSSDKTIRAMREVGEEVKTYVELRLELMRLDSLLKGTKLLASLTLIATAVLFLCLILLLLSLAAAYAIVSYYGGGLALTFVVAAGILAAALLLLYLFRKSLLFDSIANLLGNLFLKDKDSQQHDAP